MLGVYTAVRFVSYDRGGAAVAGWLAAAVPVAVAVAVDPWGLRPFTTWRWALVGVVVALAATPIVGEDRIVVTVAELATQPESSAVPPAVTAVGTPVRTP